MSYRADIDGLRAIAVLSVVIFHAFPSLIPGGFIGVDVFFVISGFLISTIIFKGVEAGTFKFSDFYSRRISRIFPSLILVSIVCYVVGWFLLFPDELAQLGKHLFGGSTFISNFILLNESGYFDNSAETKPLLHLWSLGIEEQFYFIWPIFLCFMNKGKKSFLWKVAIGFLASFILCIYRTKVNPSVAFYLPYTRFWELLAGGALAWFNLYSGNIISEKLKSKLSPVLPSLGFLLLVLSFFIIDSKTAFPGAWALLPVISCILIIGDNKDSYINKKILSNKILVWLGVISFPLYLWHWPILSFLRIVNGGMPSGLTRFIAVILSILLAWLTFKVVESKIRFRRDAKTIMSLSFSLALIGFIGGCSYLAGGIPSRSSIEEYSDNRNQLLREPSVDQACIRLVGGVKPLFDYCRYSNSNSSRNVIVMGDSHAHAAFPGISEYLKTKGYNAILFANSNCPPLIGTYTGETEAQREFCTKRIRQLLNEASKVKNVEKIFFFTRGANYLAGSEFSAEEKVNPSFMIDKKAFREGAQKTINRLKSVSTSIYFVSENPELRIRSSSCLSRPLNQVKVDCNVDRNSVYRRQNDYMQILMSLKGITVIDSRNAFCGASSCSPFSDAGVLLYADDNHLSKAGSEYQVSNLLNDYLN
ncbi:acyltransferase family protein [Yersinia intermedia]|uniref:acyltransferase family protein n=1 Tax=Yersinia intermedia TaxID=631 RepID=UPI0005DD62C7|nr:acyltransferase family protein [Yersinia intermedia]CNI92058.1 acyltransferase family protein [Yersinia intermedia]